MKELAKHFLLTALIGFFVYGINSILAAAVSFVAYVLLGTYILYFAPLPTITTNKRIIYWMLSGVISIFGFITGVALYSWLMAIVG